MTLPSAQVRMMLGSLVLIALAAEAVALVLVRRDGEDAALPSCAKAEAAIARPATLPARFPFPEGTVLTRSFRNRSTHGVPAARALLPLGVDAAVRYFDRELPRAGIEVVVRFGDPSGSEAFYSVKGFSGRYTVEELPACRRATTFLLTARPTLLGRGFSQ